MMIDERSLLPFPREIGLRRQTCRSRGQFDTYVDKLGNKSACYTSLFGFSEFNQEGRVDYSTALIDRAWWDFDSGPRGDIRQTKEDAATLMSRLEGDIRVVATGRGFHVYQMFKEALTGREWSRSLERYERAKGKGLVTLDGVGYPEKLTRVPGTFNPKRWKWAVNVDPWAFKENPQEYQIPRRPDESLDEFDPFRGHIPNGDSVLLQDVVSMLPPEPEIDYEAALTINAGPIGSLSSIPMIPCLEKEMVRDNPPHHVRVALVEHLAENLRWFAPANTLTREQKDDIVDKINGFIAALGWRDYKSSVTRGHIRSILKYDHTPSCSWFISRGMCPGPCWRYDE